MWSALSAPGWPQRWQMPWSRLMTRALTRCHGRPVRLGMATSVGGSVRLMADEVRVKVVGVWRWVAALGVLAVLVLVGVFAFQSEQSDGQRDACDRIAEVG